MKYANGQKLSIGRSLSHASTMTVLLSIILTLLLPASHAEWYPGKQAKMTPTDQLLEDGNTLILNCTLLESYKNAHLYNASDLFFMVNGQDIKSPEYVTALSPTVAQLVYPPFDLTYPDMVYCKDPAGEINGGVTTVDVARRPLMPSITECIVPDWRNMTCVWGPSLKEQEDWSHTVDNKYNLTWTVRPDQTDYVILDDDAMLTVHSWQPPWGSGLLCLGEKYTLTITTSNRLTDRLNLPTPSLTEVIDPCDRVQPKAVEDLKVTNVQPRSVEIHWTPPEVPDVNEGELTYVVQYSGRWASDILEGMINVSETNSVRIETHPNVAYTASVSAVPSVGGRLSRQRFITWQSMPDVPEMNPRISPFGFEVSYGKCGTYRLVTLHWQELDPKHYNGPDLKYRVQERWLPSRTWKTLEEETRVKGHSVCVDTDQEVLLRVLAENRMGRVQTDDVEVFRIPPVVDDPPEEPWFVVESVDFPNGTSEVLFTWKENLTTSQSGSRPKRSFPDMITLFWCLGSSLNCSGQLQWTMPNPEDGLHSVVINGPYHSYGFAMADANGMHWAPCSFDYAHVPSAPPKVVVTTSDDHGELDVAITVPGCVPGTGYAHAFDIVYCEVTDLYAEACSGKETHVRVPRGRLDAGAILLHPLQVNPGSGYLVFVYSVSRVGRSHVAHPAIPGSASRSWATAGAVTGVVIACLVLLVLFVFGVISVVRFINKKERHFKSGMAITRPDHRHSDCSSVPMLVDNYLNGSVGRSNAYLRQLSSFSTLSVDSGTGSLTYDQLSPGVPPDLAPRKTGISPGSASVQRFTSIPESPVENDEVFSSSRPNAEAFPMTPTRATPAPAPNSHQETAFTLPPPPAVRPRYANVDECTGERPVDEVTPLPVSLWDPHKSPPRGSERSTPQRHGSPSEIGSYTRASNLAGPGGSDSEPLASNLDYLPKEAVASYQDSDGSIGPASLMHSSSEWTPTPLPPLDPTALLKARASGLKTASSLDYVTDPSLVLPKPPRDKTRAKLLAASGSHTGSTKSLPLANTFSSYVAHDEVAFLSIPCADLPPQDPYVAHEDLPPPKPMPYISQDEIPEVVPSNPRKPCNGYITEDEIPVCVPVTWALQTAAAPNGYVGHHEIPHLPPPTDGARASLPKTASSPGYIPHSALPSLNGDQPQEGTSPGGYVTSNEFIAGGSPKCVPKGGSPCTTDSAPHIPSPQVGATPSGYVTVDDVIVGGSPKCVPKGASPRELCTTNSAPNVPSPQVGATPSGYVTVDDVIAGGSPKCAPKGASPKKPPPTDSAPSNSLPQEGATPGGYVTVEEVVDKGSPKCAPKGTTPKKPCPADNASYVALPNVTPLVNGHAHPVDNKAPNGYVRLDNPETQTLLGFTKEECEEEDLNLPTNEEPVPSSCHGDGYLKVEEAERQGLITSPV